jgi:hypothetical protein
MYCYAHEGNIKENYGYVVFKRNIRGSTGKKGGERKGGVVTPPRIHPILDS